MVIKKKVFKKSKEDLAITSIENKIRDLINWVQIMNEEELVAAEGKKIEDDTAKKLKAKLRALARMIADTL